MSGDLRRMLWRSCTRKKAFRTKRWAKRFAKQYPGKTFTVYRCRFCNSWHLATRR